MLDAQKFWDNRDFFFYEGMQLEIGPSFHDYSPFSGYVEATKENAGQAKIGPESSLENPEILAPLLELLAECDHPLTIVTKSALIERDLVRAESMTNNE